MASVMPDGVHHCRKHDAGDVEVSVTSLTGGGPVRTAHNLGWLRRRLRRPVSRWPECLREQFVQHRARIGARVESELRFELR